MDKKHSGSEKAAVNAGGVRSVPIDPSRMQTERRAATHRLLARLKAQGEKEGAETPRAYAQRYVREQESLILGLLNAGVGAEEILADLALSFSSIPAADLRYALTQLRDRRRKQSGALTVASVAVSASTSAREVDANNAHETMEDRPAAVRRADESEQDDGLLEELEETPDPPGHVTGKR